MEQVSHASQALTRRGQLGGFPIFGYVIPERERTTAQIGPDKFIQHDTAPLDAVERKEPVATGGETI
jgi:hypothetical protein